MEKPGSEEPGLFFCVSSSIFLRIQQEQGHQQVKPLVTIQLHTDIQMQVSIKKAAAAVRNDSFLTQILQSPAFGFYMEPL